MNPTSPEGASNEKQQDRLDKVNADEPPIEGGIVEPLQDAFVEVRHRAQTARWLAIALILILGVSFFLHYGITAYFLIKGKAEAIEGLSRAFNVWLPVISSLAGSAATYYFTRGKER